MKHERGTKLLLLILIALISVSIYLSLRDKGILEVNINRSLSDMHRSIEDIKIPKDGKTPTKGIDYFDGKDGIDGRNGEDSLSTHTIEKEIVIKQVPMNGVDGRSATIRCNTRRNRWETALIGDPTWTVVKDQDDQPVKCVIPGIEQ